MAIPQIDQALLALLAPKPRLKAQRLIAQAIDSEASFMSVIARAETLREEIGQLRASKRQAVDRARALTANKPEEAAAAAAEPFNDAINDLEGELQRLSRDRQRREDRRTNDQQVVAQVRAFLERQSATPNIALVAVTTSVPKFHDQTVIEAINRIRSEITAANQELRALTAAPLPTGEMRERARSWVNELAAIGRPTLRTAAGGFALDWHPGVYGGPMAPASIAILAALNPDGLYSLIEAGINKVSGSGLASGERPRRQQQIEDRILQLERSEETLIEQALENGHDVARRPQCSPLAILSIKTAVPALVARAS
jgi:hypothetical protein